MHSPTIFLFTSALFAAALPTHSLASDSSQKPTQLLAAIPCAKTVAEALVKEPEPVDAWPAQVAERPRVRSSVRAGGGLELGAEVAFSENDGVIGASAHGWKARFGATATTFTPYFGADAPRTESITFTLLGVTAGDNTIESDATSVVRENDRVRIERGLVDEVYACTPNTVEQLFVVDSPVAGDLTVRVGFEGPFTATPDADGIRFDSEIGSVRYGLARAIDSNGASIAVEERLSQGAIDLVVPAAWLSRATYPVTIDPLVGSFTVAATTDEYVSCDVACVNGLGVYVVERKFSVLDSDVFVRKSSDVSSFGSLYTIDDTTSKWAAPSIAANKVSGLCLVACEVGAAGARRVKTRTFDPSTNAVGAVRAVTDVFGEQLTPAVGGDPTSASPTYFLVGYVHVLSSTDQDILAEIFSDAGIPSGVPIVVDNSFSTVDANVAISKSNGVGSFSTQVWSVVWERPYSSTDHDIFGAELSWNGAVATPTFGISTSSADDRGPAVSSPLDEVSGARPYLVAMTRFAVGSDRNIQLVAMQSGVRLDGLDLDIATGTGLDSSEPVVDCDGHQFAVARTVYVGGIDYDIDLAFVSLADQKLQIGATDPLTVGGTTGWEHAPGLAAKHAGGDTSTRFYLGWLQLAPAFDEDVLGAVVQGPLGGLVESFCGGPLIACPCGNSGTGVAGCANSSSPGGGSLAGTAGAQVSGDSFQLHAAGLPAGTFVLFFQGTIAMPGVSFGDGNLCVSGTIQRLGIKPAPSGQASYPAPGDASVSVRGQVPAQGGLRVYQAWYRDAAPYCMASTFNLTNGVKTIWTP